MTTSRSRVLVVGADGADPKIIARMISERDLPNLSRLCAQGSWGSLQPTFPPVSPVAWMTCLTGVAPADHGIRDFITKSQGSYLPTIGLFRVRAGSDSIPVYASRRSAPTLGELLAGAGRTAYILKVPGTFPPPPVRGGLLSGFGMPDLLGTFGVSCWYTTDPAGKRASAPEGAELVHSLVPLEESRWRGQIPGPAGTTQAFTLRRDGGRAVLYIGSGQPVAMLSAGDWSGWLRPTFDLPGRGTVDGLCRFRLISLGPKVELYRTAVQCAPHAPLFPLSEPAGFGARLEDLVGPYATIGMPSDMDGVRRGVVDRDTFLQDAYTNWEQQVDITLRLLEDPSWDLLITHLYTLDNVQHLFWHCQDRQHPAHTPQLAARYGDPIGDAYRWLDARLGRLLDHLPPNTVVLIVSDHGGVPIYRQIYPNAWLRSKGYLVPRNLEPEGDTARIDWEQTRAAMFGTGGIWLNVQGREPRGIVPPGAPYRALRQEIADALTSWRDPQTGQPVVKRVLNGEDVFGPSGTASSGARDGGPDLLLALQPGYGLGRGEGLGRVRLAASQVTPNLSPWSGGHEGPYLPSDVPGTCILWGQTEIRANVDGASLADVAPTVLCLLGLKSVPSMAGRSLV